MFTVPQHQMLTQGNVTVTANHMTKLVNVWMSIYISNFGDQTLRTGELIFLFYFYLFSPVLIEELRGKTA